MHVEMEDNFLITSQREAKKKEETLFTRFNK